MFLQDKRERRSCLLVFAIGMALLPFFALIWLSDRLAQLAITKKSGKPKGRGANPDEQPRCSGLPQPNVDIPNWRLRVSGAVQKPTSFSIDDVKNMRISSPQGLPMACAKGWTYYATWSGTRFDEIYQRVKPTPAAKWVKFIGADGYHECVSLNKLFAQRAFLAYWLNDDVLPPNHGAPLRLIFPGKYGYKNVKWITEIVFEPQRSKGYLAGKMANYDADGSIQPYGLRIGGIPPRPPGARPSQQ